MRAQAGNPRAGLWTGPWNADATALVVVTGLLLVYGLLMSFSASFVEAAQTGDPFRIFRRQVTWAGLGVVAFAVAAQVHHRQWRRAAWPLLVVALGALVLVLIPGMGVERFGSSRWLTVGPVEMQPSELAKLAVLVWVADVFDRKRPRDGSVQQLDHLLLPALPLFGVVALLVLLQPDLGTVVLLGLIVGAILWIEGLPMRMVTAMAAAALGIVIVLALVAPYRMARITGWLSPEDDPLDTGFQLLQARYALGSGGLFGVGLGSSRAKWDFVPNPETDFIFAIIGEELGLFGAVVILALFGALLYLGMRTAYRATDPFARTVAFAVTAWIVGQALVNIAAVTGLLPITGVTLPLVSVGGSSLIVTLAALGMLVAITRAGGTLRPATKSGGRR